MGVLAVLLVSDPDRCGVGLGCAFALGAACRWVRRGGSKSALGSGWLLEVAPPLAKGVYPESSSPDEYH